MLPLLLLLAVKAVFPTGGAKPIGPYSPGILAGDYMYVSGQGARDGQGNIPPAPEAQIRQTLSNIRTILEGGGLTLQHAVYAQVYINASISFSDVDKVWKETFPNDAPARAMLGIQRMPTETPVEITVVAVTDLAKKKVVPGGVRVGDRLYISGVYAKDTDAALDQLGNTLKASGLDYRHMVFVNPYLTPRMPMDVMNKAYAKRFEFGNTPARATIQVVRLPEDAAIEFTGVAVADLSKRKAVRPKNMAPSPTASPCVFAEDTFYCSAKSGFIPGANGGIYAGEVEDQVRQTMRNLLDGLEEAGLDFSNVVASNVYLDNLDEFAKMNGVYGKYFKPGAPPTRTTVVPTTPVTRTRSASGHFPKLEEISIIAVR